MSYAFKIRNEFGKVQVSGDHMVPQFIGKIVTKDDNIRMTEYGDFGQSRSYSNPAPNFGGRDVMIFWSLPPDVWWYLPLTFMNAASSGSAYTGLFAYCNPGDVISGVPEGYVFALGSVQHSGVQPALRTWDASGNLLFDSGSLHLAVEKMATNISYPYNAQNDAGIALPSKPAFLVPHVTRYYERFDGFFNAPDGMADVKQWIGMVKRSGNTIHTRMVLAFNGQQYAQAPGSRPGYTEDQTYGNTSGLLMPVINASIYD